MTARLMTHAIDPKAVILDALGDIGAEKIAGNHVLVAIYERPEQTKGGIILPDSNRDEDLYQGKTGLIVALGPIAFIADPGSLWQKSFDAMDFQIGDWVLVRTSDGWPVSIHGKACRLVEDKNIRAKISHPDAVW